MFCHPIRAYAEALEHRAKLVAALGLRDTRESGAGEGTVLPGDCDHRDGMWAEDLGNNSRVYAAAHLNTTLADFDCWISALALTLAGWAAARPVSAETERYEPILNADDLYVEPWFLRTFLDLREDLTDVTSRGKRLAVIWEMRGCPYCKATHLVNFANPRIQEYVRANFDVLQLNMFGSLEVTDVDGEVLEEGKLARKYNVVYSPTIQFFPETLEEMEGRTGREVEVFRMSGYLMPPHFLTMFEYVKEKAYESIPFQTYVQDRKDRVL